MKLLQGYDWPGNIRQLENTIERLVISVDNDDYIQPNLVQKILNSESLDSKKISDKISNNKINDNQITVSLNDSLDGIEREIIQKFIEKEKGNKTLVANRLGISRSTLWRKLNKIDV